MQTANEIISRLVALLRDNALGLHEGALLKTLTGQGIREDIAHRAFVFMQYSCGVRYVSDQGCIVPPTYITVREDGTQTASQPLADEPFFVAAQALATRKSLGEETFEALALESPLGQALQQLVAQGSTPSDVHFTEPCMFVCPIDEALRRQLAGPRQDGRAQWWRLW